MGLEFVLFTFPQSFCIVGQPLNIVVLSHTHRTESTLARITQPLDTQLVSTLQDAATPKPARQLTRGLVRWVNPVTSIQHPGNQDGEASWNKADDLSLVNAYKNLTAYNLTEIINSGNRRTNTNKAKKNGTNIPPASKTYWPKEKNYLA